MKKISSMGLFNFVSFFIFAIVLINQISTPNHNEYVQINIQKGDTLLGLANEYSDYHSLNGNKFVTWVNKENNLNDDFIKVGDTLVIPVKKLDYQMSDKFAMGD